MLRYNKDIDYAFFSDIKEVQDRIKRAEIFRSWADIEDISNKQVYLEKNFDDHEKTAANAFKELYNHIEKTKGDLKKDFKGEK